MLFTDEETSALAGLKGGDGSTRAPDPVGSAIGFLAKENQSLKPPVEAWTRKKLR